MNNTLRGKKHISSLILFLSLVLTGIGILISLSVGAKNIELTTVIRSFTHYENILDMQLVRDVRLPRALCAAMVGAVLGVTGAIMQGVTRNPISEPSIMGITQGATLAIAISYLSGSVFGIMGHMEAAFIGALLSGTFVLAFSIQKTRKFNPSRLVLAGTALSTFFISLALAIGLLTNMSQNLAFWISGGLRTAGWSSVWLLGIFGTLGIICAIIIAPRINAVNLGDDVAIGLGENPAKVKIISFMILIPMCAAAVATAGNIAFVGLIIPQIAGKLVGQDYKRIIPCSMGLGAVLLTYSDILARMVNTPYETPVGLFTSIIGVPFFIYLLRKEKV